MLWLTEIYLVNLISRTITMLILDNGMSVGLISRTINMLIQDNGMAVG